MSLQIQDGETIGDVSFTTDDLIKIVDADRQKMRSLSQAILIVCGFLITAIFGIISVLLKDLESRTPIYIIPLFICVSLIVFLSLLKSITSMRISPLKNPVAKADSLASLNKTLDEEINHSDVAIKSLQISMAGFIIVLIIFLLNYYGAYMLLFEYAFSSTYNLFELIHFIWGIGGYLLKFFALHFCI